MCPSLCQVMLFFFELNVIHKKSVYACLFNFDKIRTLSCHSEKGFAPLKYWTIHKIRCYIEPLSKTAIIKTTLWFNQPSKVHFSVSFNILKCCLVEAKEQQYFNCLNKAECSWKLSQVHSYSIPENKKGFPGEKPSHKSSQYLIEVENRAKVRLPNAKSVPWQVTEQRWLNDCIIQTKAT